MRYGSIYLIVKDFDKSVSFKPLSKEIEPINYVAHREKTFAICNGNWRVYSNKDAVWF